MTRSCQSGGTKRLFQGRAVAFSPDAAALDRVLRAKDAVNRCA